MGGKSAKTGKIGVGSKDKEIEFEREIPQTKNPSGVFQIGELYLQRNW